MLSDTLNLLYFEFLSPIIREMENLNRKFQTFHPDMNSLLKMLELQVRSVRARVYDDRGESMHILRCDYGVKFEEQAATLDPEQVRGVRNRCREFMLSLVTEMEKRLPDNTAVLSVVTKFSPHIILKRDILFESLPYKSFCPDLVKVENQFRLFRQVKWDRELEEIVKEGSMVKFWAAVRAYELNNETIFKELADYALTCNSLPVSNAYVERIFSIVSFMKDKYANRMQIPMLDSLLLLKTHLQANI